MLMTAKQILQRSTITSFELTVLHMPFKLGCY